MIQVYLLIALVVGALSFGGGWSVASWKAKAALETYQSEVSRKAQQAAQEQFDRYQAQVHRALDAENALNAERQRYDADKALLQKGIAHATAQYRSAPHAALSAVPHCVFTREWLRDYNAALGLPSASPSAAAGGAGDASGTAAGADADLLESGVNPADILAHIVDYGARCRRLEAQVNRLIDLESAP